MKKKQVYYPQFWHYTPFKVSLPEKQTSTSANFFPTSLDICFQILYYPIHTIFLLYTFLVTSSFWSLILLLLLASSVFWLLCLFFLWILLPLSWCFLSSPFPICHILLWTPSNVPSTLLLLLFFIYLIFFSPSIIFLY